MQQEKSVDMQEKIRKLERHGETGEKKEDRKSQGKQEELVCVYGQVGGGGKFGKHKKFMKTGKLGGNRK